MVIDRAWHCMNDITQPTDIATVVAAPSSADQARRLCSERSTVTRCLFGESSLTDQDSKELIVQCSETKARINRVSLSDRLTPSLISAGLVRGIIPMSMRRRSDQLIPDGVSNWLAGSGAE